MIRKWTGRTGFKWIGGLIITLGFMESEGWFRLGFVFGNVFFIFFAKKKKVGRWRRRAGGG